MREIVAEDNVSAGKGAVLTASVVSHLAWIGETVGPVLDEVRKALHLSKLRKVSAKTEEMRAAFCIHLEVAGDRPLMLTQHAQPRQTCQIESVLPCLLSCPVLSDLRRRRVACCGTGASGKDLAPDYRLSCTPHPRISFREKKKSASPCLEEDARCLSNTVPGTTVVGINTKGV